MSEKKTCVLFIPIQFLTEQFIKCGRNAIRWWISTIGCTHLQNIVQCVSKYEQENYDHSN